ncbi:elongation of very long chain fatty acids protein 4-like isoform X2 [Homalodisca vitripennis]|uniref:elongation of very long chain fatty acids protein 4-like isoform X2 n=1 Tax=Homalodisca vitripennis TaxID=197043 RepID=UPI001EEA5984|nr:elongation of very long chain fatty acids protein 4-like isoform X2 [Homalodisca vitripennis]
MSAELHRDVMAAAGYNTSYVRDPANVDSWFLMSRPWPVLLIILLYLGFVLRLGPALMKNRRPLQMQNLLLAYNGSLVVFSVWWIVKAVFQFQTTVASEEDTIYVNSLIWYYLMSKFVELLDTVFFVLRKKQNQISFLHVYHHTNMAFFTWAFLKYIRGEQFMMIGYVNSAVHAVMYSYYFLAALGPQFRKFLWFKPYITWMQMGQFVFLIGYLIRLLVYACDLPRVFTQFAVVNTLSFLILFMNFYTQTYSNQKHKQGN